MPGEQRGQFCRSGGKWGVRSYDENGVRKRRGGFTTKTEARRWLDDRLDAVEARDRGLLRVRRAYTNSAIKLYGKTSGSLPAIPRPAPALAALEMLPARVDTPLLFPGDRGGHLNLQWFQRNHWAPGLDAAGVERRTPYALRHTFTSWSIAAGVPLFDLARFMRTSVEQIDRTYGHLLPDRLDRARAALESLRNEPRTGEAPA